MINPLADQASPPQPAGAPQAPPQNPLARLAGPLPGLPPPQPAPTQAQTVAAVRRFGAVQSAMREVMSADGFGRTDMRPKILDEASKLMAAKVSKSAGDHAERWRCARRSAGSSGKGQGHLQLGPASGIGAAIDHHGAAVATGRVPRSGGEKYAAANDDRHISELLKHYPKV